MEDPATYEIITITVCYKLAKINALMDKRAETIEKIRLFKLKGL